MTGKNGNSIKKKQDPTHKTERMKCGRFELRSTGRTDKEKITRDSTRLSKNDITYIINYCYH